MHLDTITVCLEDIHEQTSMHKYGQRLLNTNIILLYKYVSIKEYIIYVVRKKMCRCMYRCLCTVYKLLVFIFVKGWMIYIQHDASLKIA